MTTLKTKVIVDNTTFASAGRALYYGYSNTGGEHAKDYYKQYKDAKEQDMRSLAELITAIILFDELFWDDTSYVQERKEFNEEHFNDAWLYKWFPIFGENRDIIIPLEKSYEARLQNAREFTINWVKKELEQGTFILPNTFKVPLVYKSKEHLDRAAFEQLNEEYNLSDDFLSIAMFLHRGLYYQSLIYFGDNYSYLPHSYRACLLNELSLKFLAQVCHLAPSIYAVPGSQIVKDIDEVVIKNLTEATNIANIPTGLAIGYSFFQKDITNPERAIMEALNFRYSVYGEEIRENFRNLISLGIKGNKQAINDRIAKDINKQVKEFRKFYFGTSGEGESFIDFLIDKLPFDSGSWVKLFVEKFVPRKYYECLTSLLNYPIKPTAYQLIFSNYIIRPKN